MGDDNNRTELQTRFIELSDKYYNALKKDLEFDELKCIYVELKEIKQKLSSIQENIAGDENEQ